LRHWSLCLAIRNGLRRQLSARQPRSCPTLSLRKSNLSPITAAAAVITNCERGS
jgi:hypothetical protein